MQYRQSRPKTEICKICFKSIEEFTFHNLVTIRPTICHECLVKLEPVMTRFMVDNIECLHVYFYNQSLQEILYQYKGCYDYELHSVFLEYYVGYLRRKYRKYTLIPAPSSEKSDKERGFNHVVEMFKCLNLETIRCIHKIVDIKQSDLTFVQRQKNSKNLVIDDVNLKNKKLLLVDDVFTTGSTIRSMIKLVKEKGAKIVKVLVMSKTKDLDKR